MSNADVVLAAEGTAAEICARYLAGAGVGRLAVPEALRAACIELNPDVSIQTGPSSGTSTVNGHPVVLVELDDPVESGARWAWLILRTIHPGQMEHPGQP
ncbi:MAG: hypothetical protein ACFB9M_06670 [Myxococcota bacterium]